MSTILNLNSLTAYNIDGQAEKIQFDTEVVVSDEKSYTTLEYIEPPADAGSDAVLTRLTAHSDGTATYVRTAASTGRQIMGITFKQGETAEFVYSSDVGVFKMRCKTKLVRHNISEKGGVVVIRYLLDFGDGDPIEYGMIITIEDKNAKNDTDSQSSGCTGSCESCPHCG